MYLREIAIYADPAIADQFPTGFVDWFHRETCCITELYISLLRRKVRTPDISKIHLDFVEQNNGFVTNFTKLIYVLRIQYGFDFYKYSNLDYHGKQHMILDSLQSASIWIANKQGWNVGAFESCYTEAIASNLTFEGWAKTSWVSPNRKYRAKLGFCHKLRTVDFFVGVFDMKGREIGRKPLGSVVPEMDLIDPILKRSTGKWRAFNMFRIVNSSPHFFVPKYWEADVSDLVASDTRLKENK